MTRSPRTRDTGLALISQVTIDEPEAQVEPGQVFNLGPHVLLCCDVLTDWATWVPHLKEGTLFCPYPSPYLALGDLRQAVRAGAARPVSVRGDDRPL